MAQTTEGQMEGIRRASITNKSGPILKSFPSRPLTHSMVLGFKKYDYTALGEYGILDPKSSVFADENRVSVKSEDYIQLPFPTQLTDSNNLDIGPFERDLFAATIADKLKPFAQSGTGATLQSSMNSLGSAASRGLDSVMNFVSSGGEGGGAAVKNAVNGMLNLDSTNVMSGAQYLLRSKLGQVFGGEVGRTLDNVTGQTINPRTTLAFNGAQLKSHSFTWELYPSNRQDTKNIKAIVDTIKKNALPGVRDLPGIKRAFLQYPAIVNILLFGVDSNYWVQFKPAMITDFTIDYGGGGLVSIMRGGVPAAVSIGINLTELEIHTAEEYGAGDLDQVPAQTLSDEEQRRQNIISASAG